MTRKMINTRLLLPTCVLATAAFLTACGGGGAGSSGSSTPAATAAQSAAVSSGTVTAFGSVFVNGHEFDSSSATIVDDDTGASVPGSSATSALAVGMDVDVTPAAGSTNAAPKAQEIHITPLVRGPVDASDSTAAQLSVLGQLVQLSATTVFKDARACSQGSAPSCTPVADQSGLLANCSSSSGNYTCASSSGSEVQVFGFASGSTVSATLVRVIDNTAGIYRATGVLGIATGGTPPGSYSINGLHFATATACTASIECTFSSGNLVTTRGTTVPVIGQPGSTLPIPVVFSPASLHASRSSALTVGSTIELEGIVSNSTSSSYVVQGVTVTPGSGQNVPANGDRVEVSGTVTSVAPPAITALSETTEGSSQTHAGGGFLIEDTLTAQAVSAKSPATVPPTYTVTLLGTTFQVNALTGLEDETAGSAGAFNINTFASYIGAYGGAASGAGTPHIVVRGYIDTSGSTPVLVAVNLRIIKTPPQSASSNARIAGVVTAKTTTNVTLDGVTLPFAGTVTGPGGTLVTLAVGDFVQVRFNDAGGTQTVVSVVDFGMRQDHGGE